MSDATNLSQPAPGNVDAHTPSRLQQWMSRRLLSSMALVAAGALLATMTGAMYEAISRPGERPVLFLFEPRQSPPRPSVSRAPLPQPALPLASSTQRPTLVRRREMARLQLQQVDLVLVVDATSSMGGVIEEVKHRLTDITHKLYASTPGNAFHPDLRVGLVLYRDHPNQEPTFTTRSYPLTADADQIESQITSISAQGGGDTPEAVYDGIAAALQQPFRTHSRRILIVVGDAPPHLDGQCPCGLTAAELGRREDLAGATLYTLGVGNDPEMTAAFISLAARGHGKFFSLDRSVSLLETLQAMSRHDQEQLEALLAVYNRLAKGEGINQVAAETRSSPAAVEAQLGELKRRGISPLTP